MTGSASGFRVIRPEQRSPDADSGAMRREAAVSTALVGAEKIWAGHVTLGPGLVSAVHHHGEAESVIFVISGQARFFSGEALEEAHDATAGDFVWVPPHVVHVEANLSDRSPVEMVVMRSTQEALVFNLPTPEGWVPNIRSAGD